MPAFTQVRSGVDTILADLPRWRKRVARIDNQALFEVPRILQRLLVGAQPPV